MVTSCSQNREVWFGDNGKQLSVPKNKTEKNVSVAGLIFFYLFVYSLPVCLRDSPPWSTAKWRVLNTHAHPKWHSSHGEPGGAINHCSVWSWRKTLIFLFPTFPGLYDTFWSKLLYFCFSFLLKKKRTTHDVTLTLYVNPTIMSILQHIHCIHTHLWFISKTRIVIWIIVFFPPTQQNTWLYKFA